VLTIICQSVTGQGLGSCVVHSWYWYVVGSGRCCAIVNGRQKSTFFFFFGILKWKEIERN